MQVTIGQILEAQPVLQMIANKPLKAVTAWKIASRLRRLHDEVQVANEARSKVFAKYSDIVGDSYKPREATMDEFTKELNELFAQEVDVTVTPMNVALIEDVEITPSQAVAVSWIFSEDAE